MLFQYWIYYSESRKKRSEKLNLLHFLLSNQYCRFIPHPGRTQSLLVKRTTSCHISGCVLSMGNAMKTLACGFTRNESACDCNKVGLITKGCMQYKDVSKVC
jgi:hypothetical protein